MTLAYKTGQITLTNGSASVVGVGTAWETSLIAGGVIYPQADGNPLPIESVDGDLGITSATKWTGATGTYDYALVRDTAYLQQVSANSSKLAQLVAELAAGTIFKYDASGDLAGRATYDERPKDFAYLVSIGVDQPQLYVKASAASGDWSGPFNYGTGPMGPPTELTFGATVTESPSTPASVVVVGDGPYQLTFHIPRGADGDMEPAGAWPAGSNYSAKQVVTDNGSAYVCKASHVAAAANEPGVGASWATYWDLLVAKGGQGIQGPPGPMDPAIYDPTAVHGDAFLRSNHKGDIPDTVLFADDAAPTKKARLELSGITAGQTRIITLPDRSFVLNPAWEQIGNFIDLAGISIVDWPNLSPFRTLRLKAAFVASTASGGPFMRFSTDNGMSFLSGSTDYTYMTGLQQGAALSGAAPTNSSIAAFFSASIDSVVARVVAEIENFNKAFAAMYSADGVYINSGNLRHEGASGFNGGAVARNALRLTISAGAFSSGYAVLEGIRG